MSELLELAAPFDDDEDKALVQLAMDVAWQRAGKPEPRSSFTTVRNGKGVLYSIAGGTLDAHQARILEVEAEGCGDD